MVRTTYGYTNLYMTKDGEPWFPVMGEFHYSRFPEDEWERSLYKMKMGGVDIVSSYVIWIHHEKIKGEYNFSGNRNLRKFIELIGRCGLKMILRIGPWCHAEVRYGGFPQWLMESEVGLRTNDGEYLNIIKEFFEKVYEQIDGLLDKDGGPVIGMQIENEHGHAGMGVKGDEAHIHMGILMDMIKEIGFDVPIYTATGWGGAIIGECIPVMGGYCEAPWEKTTDELPPNNNYVITYERDDHNIGKGRPLGYGAVYDINKFPYLTAELGGGLQVTYDRRPVAYAKDIGAVSLVKLASGVNLLGYYMYHGGRNPEEEMHETQATGSWCELPEFNYDFRAPIGAYGQISDTYKELKLLTMFLKDFGGEFCTMPAYIPDTTPDTPQNLTDLRTSVRHNGQSGYVFVNNYQRRYEMAEHSDVQLSINLPEKTIKFPKIDISDGQYFFYPFNFKFGGAVIKTALATPLCVLGKSTASHTGSSESVNSGAGDKDADIDAYIFYSDREEGDRQFDIEGHPGNVNLICLSRQEALNAWKIKKDRDYLIICDGAIVDENGSVKVLDKRDGIVKIYPKPSFKIKDYEYGSRYGSNPDEDGFYVLTPKDLKKDCKYTFTEVCIEEETDAVNVSGDIARTYSVTFGYAENISECFISVDFDGNTGRLYVNGETVDDWFYTGEPWIIGLKQFGFPSALEIEITPLKENDPIFIEKWPEMNNGSACAMRGITAHDEYEREL